MTGPSGPGCSGSRATCSSTPTAPPGSRPARARGAAEDGGPDAGLDQVLDRQLLAAALQRLSPAHRAVLVETFYRGSTWPAWPASSGIPPGTVRSRLHYALQALRQYLDDPRAATS